MKEDKDKFIGALTMIRRTMLLCAAEMLLCGVVGWSMVPTVSFGGSADKPRGAAAGAAFGAYEIKAGFIYRFISFVSWPEARPDKGTITIGVLGPNPFGEAFVAVEGSKVGSDVVRIKYFDYGTDLQQLQACQLLYVVGWRESEMRQLLKALAGGPTLTISDSPSFIDKGGMIGFVVQEDDRIGIEVNAAAARSAGLVIRSMLMRIALRVIDDQDSARGM